MYTVFIVGHTDCGGVKASYEAAHNHNQPSIPGSLGQWLAPVVELSRRLGPEVLYDQLAARNVEEQFNRLVASAAFRDAGRIGGFIPSQ